MHTEKKESNSSTILICSAFSLVADSKSVWKRVNHGGGNWRNSKLQWEMIIYEWDLSSAGKDKTRNVYTHQSQDVKIVQAGKMWNNSCNGLFVLLPLALLHWLENHIVLSKLQHTHDGQVATACDPQVKPLLLVALESDFIFRAARNPYYKVMTTVCHSQRSLRLCLSQSAPHFHNY